MKSHQIFSVIGKSIALLLMVLVLHSPTARAAGPVSFSRDHASLQGKKKSVSSAESYAIVYMRSKDFEKILDYKEDLESVFDTDIRNRLRIVGLGEGEFAIVYDGNLSARTVPQMLVRHAQLLATVGYDEPYSTRKENFHTLFNISYGMGRNLDSLKDSYQLLYSMLDEEVKQELFIEKTDFNNYLLVYRLRGDQASANAIAKRHSQMLRGKRISASLAKENSNTVVYGESSLFDEVADKEAGARPARGGAEEEKREKSKSQATSLASGGPSTSGRADDRRVGEREPRTGQRERLSGDAKESDVVEGAIAEYLETLRRKGVIDKDEATGWMVYDLESDRKLADINAEVKFQAASMIKPFVALAFFHRVKEGRLQYDKQSRRQMEAMIQRSSNPATNYFIRKVGGPQQCNTILSRHYGHIFKTTEIKEYIPADGRTYLNSASPADYVRFLRSLWNMELPNGKEIRRVMALPGRDRLYFGTKIPRGTLVYNKTGTTARLCGDMGILVAKTRGGAVYPYAIVGIIERRNKAQDYGQWMASRSRVIRDVSTLVYEGLKKDHRLL